MQAAAGEHASPSSGKISDDQPPLVTIVVPVLNGERYIRESLDSILDQTHNRLEVIVMDDASTDRTEEIVASYGDRIRYIRQPSTRGIYENANSGIAIARGDYVGVFHADDVYLPTLVQREVEWLLAHPDAGAVFCSDIFVDAAGREFGRLKLPEAVRGSRPLHYDEVLNALLAHKNAFLRCPTALVRASIYRELGNYNQERFRNTADVEMWLRIARSHTIGVLEDHLLLYRRGHGSSSERYHQRRTAVNRFFSIIDLELESGGRRVASVSALRAYEAHRAEDKLLRAVSYYILADRTSATTVLGHVRLRDIASSRAVQRARLVLLTIAMRALVRLPRIPAVARLFDRRWHRSSQIRTAAGPA